MTSSSTCTSTRTATRQHERLTVKALVTLASRAETSVGVSARLATRRTDVNVVYGEAGTHSTFLPPTNVHPPDSHSANITQHCDHSQNASAKTQQDTTKQS